MDLLYIRSLQGENPRSYIKVSKKVICEIMPFQRIFVCNYHVLGEIHKIHEFWNYRDFLYIKSTYFLWRISRTFQFLDTCTVPTDILQNKSMDQWSKNLKPCDYMKRYFQETQLLILDYWHYIDFMYIKSMFFFLENQESLSDLG